MHSLKTHPFIRHLFGTYLALIVLVFASPSFAVDYPQFDDVYVNDFANVLDDDQEDALRDGMKRLRDQTGIEMVVVSIDRMSDYGYTAYDYKPFATGLFNNWGVGNKDKNNGIMVLLSTQDRFARIEVGAGYGKEMNERAQSVFDQQMKPLLAKNKFSEGLMAGAKGMLYEAQRPEGQDPSWWEKIKLNPNPILVPAHILFWGGLFGFSIAKGTKIGRGVLNGAVSLFMVRQKKCSHCSRKMQRLSAFDKMQYLNDEQHQEERLGGCDWMAFECQSCKTIDTVRAIKWFSNVESCPKCHKISLENSEEVTTKPSFMAKGLKEVKNKCGMCGYVNVSVVSFSGSSSGGGFGGGSSGGGGGGGRF